MESQRSLLTIGLALVTFLLWTEWNKAQAPVPVPVEQTVNTPTVSIPAPAASGDIPKSSDPVVVKNTGTTQLITVKSNVVTLKIDPRGGDIVSATLRQYPTELNGDIDFTLLNSNPGQYYTAQSGLVGTNGTDKNGVRPIYDVEKFNYDATETANTVALTLYHDNMAIVKTFTVEPNSYLIRVSHDIVNNSLDTKQVRQFAQLNQVVQGPETSMFMQNYRGAAYSTSDKLYEKFDFDDFGDERLSESTQGGWVSMIQHYFVSAWIPPQSEQNNIYSIDSNGTKAIIGFTGESTTIAPATSVSLATQLYVGPKDQKYLGTLAEGLDLTIDYGIFWWLAKPLFWLLTFIYSFAQNWGFAIIGTTIVVKTLLFYFTQKQYESMAKLRAIQPKMEALKSRFADDRQKLSQGMMELYKKEKVNPMGGCLPLLIQMPIFLALYWVLLESVELRHADFIFWIDDLSSMDPFFVLPILTGASMYLLQRLQPMNIQDPMQAKIMQYMPVAMSIFFIWFPSGLVLYWFISNVITIIQAKLIYASMEKKGLKAK